MGRLENKVAVITGAGSGMGKAMCERFVAEGAKVICADRSGNQQAVAQSLGEQAIAVQADVTNADDVQKMIDTAVDRFGRLDVLCNNAGFNGEMAPLAETSEEAYEQVVAVNLKGVFLGMKYGIEAMLRTGGGAIVNTASVGGLMGWQSLSVYSAAKGGVVLMTKSTALDYADKGIRVNAVCPGMTWTGMTTRSKGTTVPPEGAETPYHIPMGRWGLAREIAAVALFLASDDASFVTGVALPVDGGFSIGTANTPAYGGKTPRI